MKIEKVWFDDDTVFVRTDSGHIIGNPIIWYKRLYKASHEQRMKFEIGPTLESIHWEELNEDLSLESFFDFNRELNYASI
jgi:hypothetical protein